MIAKRRYYGAKTILTLEDLETTGFLIDDFVNYKNDKVCDKKYSFATKTKKDDGKYYITVYYKCDEESNYNYKDKYL